MDYNDILRKKSLEYFIRNELPVTCSMGLPVFSLNGGMLYMVLFPLIIKYNDGKLEIYDTAISMLLPFPFEHLSSFERNTVINDDAVTMLSIGNIDEISDSIDAYFNEVDLLLEKYENDKDTDEVENIVKNLHGMLYGIAESMDIGKIYNSRRIDSALGKVRSGLTSGNIEKRYKMVD